MGLFSLVLDMVVPPASMVMLAFAWPSLAFIHAFQWMLNHTVFRREEDMEGKVVVITGASSGIGEHIAYEYAKRRANLVLIARQESRLWWIRERAIRMGARNVLVIGADVVREEDCRRFIDDTIFQFGRVDHLVNTASLGHTFYFEDSPDASMFPHLMDINFWGNVYPTYVALPHLRHTIGRIIVNASVENWIPMPRMSLYAAAKAALINFYETLRYELGDDVGITIATHGANGSDMSKGKIMVDDGADVQWKEERDVQITGRHVEEYARQIVRGACRGEQHVRSPSWQNVFVVYKMFAPDVLGWTFRLLLTSSTPKRTSHMARGWPQIEGTPTRKLLTGPVTPSPRSRSPVISSR